MEPETDLDPGRSQIFRKKPLDRNPDHVLKVIQVSPRFPELGGQTGKEEFENDSRREHITQRVGAGDPPPLEALPRPAWG